MACGDGYLECGEICDSTLGVPSGYRCTSACLLERLGYGAVLPDFFLGVEIYNIQKQVDRFSATITWDTNKDAVCSFEWGRTLQYFTNIANEIEYKRTHAVRVIDLMPATTYFYTMECRDGWEHQANTPVYRFTTEQLEDKTAPANVSNFKAGAATDAIILSWENPPDADLAGVKIVRSERFFARSQSEGKVIFSGRGTRALDREVAPGKRYYYTAFAYDKNGNYSSGSLASALVKKPGTSGIVKQAEPAATQPRDKREEQAGEGERPIEKPAEPGVEVEPFPEPQEPQEPQEPEDDGQSRLPEEIEALEFPYDKLEFYAALGSLRVEAENKEVYYYSGTEFSVKIAKDLLPEGVAGLILSLKKADDSRAEYQNYYFEGNGSENEFSVKAVTPKDSAWYVLTVSALDPDNYVIMRGEGRMVVADRSYVSSVISFSGGQPVPVEGALISLYSLEGGELYKWEASEYLQFNPIYTDMLGSFGFYVPNGKYVVKAEKENFYKYQSLPIEVKHNFIKHDIELIHIPGVNLWIYVLYAIVLISCYFLLRRIVLIIRDQRKHKEAYRRIGPYERN